MLQFAKLRHISHITRHYRHHLGQFAVQLSQNRLAKHYRYSDLGKFWQEYVAVTQMKTKRYVGSWILHLLQYK